MKDHDEGIVKLNPPDDDVVTSDTGQKELIFSFDKIFQSLVLIFQII